jgi:glycosyltransferase involved in cell wall biosynthesis
MTPQVSICIPNLNTLPFLPERFDTIFRQSFQDWELLVYDGYSEDGAWDYISGIAKREPRRPVVRAMNPYVIKHAQGKLRVPRSSVW